MDARKSSGKTLSPLASLVCVFAGACVAGASLPDLRATSGETGNGEAGAMVDAAPFTSADGARPKVVWDTSESIDAAQGAYPAVAAGPGVAGSWMVQIQQHFPDTYFQQDWQVGTIGGMLGPPVAWTDNAQWTLSPPGSGLAAMSSDGSLFELASPPAGGPLYWYVGQLDATRGEISWPYGDLRFGAQGEIDGYRPRLGSTWLGAGQGAVGVAVYMASAAPGPLGYFTAAWEDLDASPVAGAISYWSVSQTYDVGPSQNPAVALAGEIAIEVHQDATTHLSCRLGSLSPNTAAIAWQTLATPYPEAEQGSNPAVAIYGSTLVEVHQGLGGDLRWMTGTIIPEWDPVRGKYLAALRWDGPSQTYESAGADPAIAIDPTTGNGVEVHASASRDGTLTRRAFRVAP